MTFYTDLLNYLFQYVQYLFNTDMFQFLGILVIITALFTLTRNIMTNF